MMTTSVSAPVSEPWTIVDEVVPDDRPTVPAPPMFEGEETEESAASRAFEQAAMRAIRSPARGIGSMRF